jgi:DNA/RNA endonuclease YhcR with UshA esterase domain
VTVEGVLQDVFNNGKAVYLAFHKPHRGHFIARIMKPEWGNFASSPETLFKIGDRVRVTGVVEWYQGDPMIYIHEPEQIQFAALAAATSNP